MRIELPRGRAIELVQGDITAQSTDAIVNAANSSLMGGGGVDGAIHRAGGPAILEQCRNIRDARGPLAPGQAVTTSGGNLAARHVIHTVGPIWQGGHSGESDTLAVCYHQSLRVADELNLTSVSFPAISTGAFGYPLDQATPVAVNTVRWLLPELKSVRLVRFIVFDERTYQAYERVLSAVGDTSRGKTASDLKLET